MIAPEVLRLFKERTGIRWRRLCTDRNYTADGKFQRGIICKRNNGNFLAYIKYLTARAGRMERWRDDMRLILDAMGGDNAPLEILKGAAEAYREIDADIVLVGDIENISSCASENDIDLTHFSLVHAAETITMEDDPIRVLKTKKNASMYVGLSMLSEEKGDALVSAGNTGALFTGATFITGRIDGIRRAAIGTVLPFDEPCLLLDSGANVTVTDVHLEEFAVMGSAYMKKMYGIHEPNVGLLNIGTEERKGTQLQITTNRRLSESRSIRYIGNIEGNTLPFSSCNVLVCDGFTGNIYLKAIEGMGNMILGSLKKVYKQNALTKLSALAVKDGFTKLKQSFDPSEHGGAPILGISKPVVKAHGSSDARAVKNALFAALHYAESNVINDILYTAYTAKSV